MIYVSVNSKPDHLGRPGIRTFLLPRGSSFRLLLLPGSRRFESEKCSTVSVKRSNFLFVVKDPTAANKAGVRILVLFYTPFAETLL